MNLSLPLPWFLSPIHPSQVVYLREWREKWISCSFQIGLSLERTLKRNVTCAFTLWGETKNNKEDKIISFLRSTSTFSEFLGGKLILFVVWLQCQTCQLWVAGNYPMIVSFLARFSPTYFFHSQTIENTIIFPAAKQSNGCFWPYWLPAYWVW